MICEVQRTENAAPLFAGWQETIIWSCLQKVMGHIYADTTENPKSAMALLGDFCFLAGKPNHELVLFKPKHLNRDFVIMVPRTEDWEEVIRNSYGDKARKVTRYAMKKEPDVFCKDELREAVNRFGDPIKAIDEELFHKCGRTQWCRDLVAQYADYETYRRYGLGFVVMKGEEIVAGASSYSGYQGGIEIEIDTKEAYRRQGMAYACGAWLILECLERGWYPSWDAQNLWSVALAQKLGYHFEHEYTAYEIWGF